MVDNDLCCLLCNLKLKQIFIACIDCKNCINNPTTTTTTASSCFNEFYICLECFSQGLENQIHKNTHSYKVLNLNLISTFSGWSVRDELLLIENFHDLITQNWSKVSAFINDSSYAKKTPIECKIHFDDWLNLINFDKNLENFNINTNIELFVGDGSFAMRENDINPPRPNVHSYQYKRMSGYRAARGDFEAEFNNSFEMKFISDIDYESYVVNESNGNLDVGLDFSEPDVVGTVSKHEQCELEGNLKFTILDSYRDLIKQRYRLKKFIRDFGLLNDLAINSLHSQAIVSIQPQISLFSQQQNTLPLKFYRLFETQKKLIEYNELINYQNELKKRLNELYEYRNNGIKKFKNIELYKKLKSIRENRNKSSHLSSLLTTVIRHDLKDKKLNANNCTEWLKKFILDEREFEIFNPVVNGENSYDDSSMPVSTTAAPMPIAAAAAPIMSSTASLISQQKYKNNPLKIENYPEADKLNDEEKEFCRVSRIQPIVYLRVKQILILECNKVGYVTYSRARKIASIDVNKTRKIHNFLLHLDLIKANNDNEVS